MTHHVYISYSPEDEAAALGVCRKLEAAGIPCWLAGRDMLPGSSYLDQLAGAIKDASAAIFILSSNSSSSQFFEREWEFAFLKKKPVIPYQIEETLRSHSHKLDLYMTAPVSVFHPRPGGEVPEELVAAIRRILPEESEGSARATEPDGKPSVTVPSQGRVTRVFISSTFRDMSAERETLAKYILPQLLKISDMEACAPVGREGRGSFEKVATGDRDSVDCTVYSPPEVRRGDRLFLQVYAHIPGHAEEARAMAREFDSETERRGFTSLGTQIQRGSVLTFELWIPGLAVEDAVQKITWLGRTEYVQFDVHIPPAHPPGSVVGKVSVSQDTVPIGLIRVKVKVVENSCLTDGRREVCGESKRYNMAFISYASPDRLEVIKRVQMLSAVGISYFQDVMDLAPGDRWALELYRHIDASDVLFLFWSSAARESEWVTKEWRYGLSQKGDEFIHPVVIEGPPPPSPPPELAHIHFADRVLYFMR